MRYLKTESTYILGNFTTGDTVTITIYRLSDDTKVVDAATCSEIGTTGRFKYLFSQSVTTKTEYLWIMTNGTEEQQGKVILGGYPDDIKAQTDKMNFVGTDIKATLDGEKVNLSDTTESQIDNIENNVTNPDQYKADVLDLAKEATVQNIKNQTDKLKFNADNDVKATLDGEKVVLTDETEAQIDAIEENTDELVTGEKPPKKRSYSL